MNLIQATVNNFLPGKRKSTPSGWTSFDAVCCHHNGENRDTRKRGGLLFNNDGFQYHCFNCNFKAGWSPGKLLSKNTKKLFDWLGIPQDEISQMSMFALRNKEDIPTTTKTLNFDLKEVELPEGSLSLIEWAGAELPDDYQPKLIDIYEYVLSRGFDPAKDNFYWSPIPGYVDRLIIPFYHEGKIVGYTCRKINNGKPKYLTDAQPGYVFNLDSQKDDRKYVIVVEGQFDALSIDGCAIMHNEPSEVQVTRLKLLQKDIIVVPDRDRAGAKMIKAALENQWSVSLPDWGNEVKDVNDAVVRFGKIYTLATILKYRETNEIKIQLLKKKLENLNDD